MNSANHPTIQRLIELEKGVHYSESAPSGVAPFVTVTRPSTVLLSAPHGCRAYRNSSEEKWHEEDEYTAGMALLLAEMCGTSVIANVWRSDNCDPNHCDAKVHAQEKCPYKQRLGELVKAAKIQWVLDLHGLSEERLSKHQLVDLGTRKKNHSMQTKHRDKLSTLIEENLGTGAVSLDFRSASTSGTITTFCQQQLRVEAIQIEMKPSVRVALRRKEASVYGELGPFSAPPKNVLGMIEALASFIRYLSALAPATTERWASPPHTSGFDFLTAAGSQIPVSLISVPRAQIKCERAGNWETIATNAALADFDQVPLTDESGLQIEGVFARDEGRLPLREEMFIAADAPLLTFLESADRQRFRFLLSGSNISGMVTLSDVQKLPVYSILFSLVLAVEMLLMEWIRKKCGTEPDKWMNHLHEGQRGTIEKHWREARDRNLWIERLSFASIGQEIRSAAGLGLFRTEPEQEQKLKSLEELRHLVCHAAEFAPTISEALKIPNRVRDARSVAAWLQTQIAKCPS